MRIVQVYPAGLREDLQEQRRTPRAGEPLLRHTRCHFLAIRLPPLVIAGKVPLRISTMSLVVLA